MTDREMVLYLLKKVGAEYDIYNGDISLKSVDNGTYCMTVASTQFFFDEEGNIRALLIEE
jgi:hypothetical protein